MDFLSIKFILSAVILIFFLTYWGFSFTIIYHLTRFGIGTQPKKFSAVFLLGSITLFFVSALFLTSIDLESFNFLKVKFLIG